MTEIVVTAQKREENLQSVPMSISSFSSEALAQAQIETMNDLKGRTPSLVFDQFAPGQPRYFIRGIGNINRSASVDSAVGVFVDEVYMGRPQMTATDFADLDRIDVLRGPQGTLFGRNVVGGAVSYFTRKPDDRTAVEGRITIGNYETLSGSGLLSGPIADGVAGKIVVSARSHSGYAFNETTERDIEDERFIAARGALRFEPTPELDILLSADFSRTRGSGPWWDLAIEGPNSIGKSNPDPRRGRNGTDDGYSRVDNSGVSLNAQWDAGFGTFTSITAYRYGDLAVRANSTGLFVAALTDPDRANYHHTQFIQQEADTSRQFTQELRLDADIGSSLQFVGGVFYMHEDVDRLRLIDYRYISWGREGVFSYDATNVTDAVAVFGNAIWEVLPGLKVQGGLRWSRDKKKHDVFASGANYAPFTSAGEVVPSFTAPAEASWEALTPSFTVNYQVSRDLFLYATASRGFKSGGFNDTENERLSAQTPFDPEYAWSYEAGIKSELFDRHLRLNASAFHMDYTDLQVTTIQLIDPDLPPFYINSNAGKAKVRGFELEMTAVPVRGVNIYGNFTYTDSSISDLSSGGVALDGNRLARAPKIKYFIGATVTRQVGGLEVTGRVDFSHQSSFFSTIENRPTELVGAQDTLDAGLTIASSGGPWALEIWGKNLLDQLQINTISNVLGEGYATYNAPRTYGLTLRYRY